MTTRVLASLLLLTLIGLPGCIRSLHPIYTEQTLTYDPAFVGVWVDSKEENRLEIASDKAEAGAIQSYRVVNIDKDSKSARLSGHLAKVGDMLVADLTISDENQLPDSDFAKSHLFPLHTFWIVKRDDADHFSIRAIDADWMKKFAAENPAGIAHYRTNDDIILTAPPEELQKFLIAHAKDQGMLTDAEVFRRVAPAPAASQPASRP